MKKETVEWLKKANNDIKTADYNLKGRRLDAAAFYSQQASEKALKAVQIEKLGKFSKIHDLVALAGSVNATDDIKKSCARISPFYTIIRYPDVIEKINNKTAKDLLDESKKVVSWAKQILSQRT